MTQTPQRSLSATELETFNQQIISLARSGAPLVPGLRALAEDLESGLLHDTVQSMIRDMEGGMSLADTLAGHRVQFPPLFAAMAEAGAASGNLRGVMEMLNYLVTSGVSLRRRIFSLAAYPLVVLAILMGLVVAYFTFLFPHLVAAFKDFGFDRENDAMERFIAWQIGGLLPLVIVLVAVLLVLALRFGPNGRERSKEFWARIPLFGPVLKAEQMFVFSRTLAILVKAGVPIRPALRLAGEVVSQSAFRDAVSRATEDVAGGVPLSQALARQGVFPVAFTWMVSLAESRGDLASGLAEAGEFYREEAERRSSFLLAVTPVGLVAGVGVVMLGVMAPIFGMLITLIGLMARMSGNS